MTPPLWQNMKKNYDSERGEWKRWLKTQCSEKKDHGIQSHHFMANRWENNGNCDRLYFGGLQNHLDGDCSHGMKRCLLHGRKAMTNLESILKSRDITFLITVCILKAMVFPVVMYGCETWTTKKAEHQRIDAFELWCWSRLLRVPWKARRSNQSMLKEISTEYSLEGLMLKLKLQSFGHLIRRTDSLEKTLMLAKTEGRRKKWWQSWDCWMASPTQWTWVWESTKSWWWTGSLAYCSSWDHKEWDTNEWLTEWFLNCHLSFDLDDTVFYLGCIWLYRGFPYHKI